MIDYNGFWKVYCVTFFPYKSVRNQNLTLSSNRSRSTQGHHFNKYDSTAASDATYYQLSRSSAFWFQKRRFFKVFIIYGHVGHLGHVTWTIWTNFNSPIPWRLHKKFDFDWSSGFWGEDFLVFFDVLAPMLTHPHFLFGLMFWLSFRFSLSISFTKFYRAPESQPVSFSLVQNKNNESMYKKRMTYHNWACTRQNQRNGLFTQRRFRSA